MDPNRQNQIATAPPQEWNMDKSSPNNDPAPPPYQGFPYPGSFQPGVGFPQPQQGFGSPPSFPGAVNGQQPYPPGFQYPAHPGIFSVAPPVVVTRTPLENPVNNFMCYSIFTTLFCCLPLGIAALIHSTATNTANQTGDRDAAERNSRLARILNHCAVGFGILIYIICIAVVVVAVVGYSNPKIFILMDPKLTRAPPQESGEARLPMVYNPLPPPYQEIPLQEPPPLQAFGNFAGAGFDPPDFVTVQPIPYMMDEVQRKPVKDYLGYSIFTTLCCCLPIGMAALVQSVITREANFYGNWMRAKKRSKKALILNNLALGAGLFIITSVLVFFLWIACLRY